MSYLNLIFMKQKNKSIHAMNLKLLFFPPQEVFWVVCSVLLSGQMDTKSVSCLVNSISRFLHLLSSFEMKNMPTQNGYRNIASSLKLLKLILDNIVESKVSSDEILCKECEKLDVAVNEAREFMENWSPKMSKICSVSTFFPFENWYFHARQKNAPILTINSFLFYKKLHCLLCFGSSDLFRFSEVKLCCLKSKVLQSIFLISYVDC